MLLLPKHQEFLNLAESYCKAVEQPLEIPIESLLAIREALIALYASAISLPEILGATHDDLPIQIPLQEQQRIRKTIAEVTSPDYFWFCYRPFITPFEQPVACSLSDSLADIWHDLKPGLLALGHGHSSLAADIFWDWKFSFDNHWGDHAVDSIWAIHKLLRDASPEIAG